MLRWLRFDWPSHALLRVPACLLVCQQARWCGEGINPPPPFSRSLAGYIWHQSRVSFRVFFFCCVDCVVLNNAGAAVKCRCNGTTLTDFVCLFFFFRVEQEEVFIFFEVGPNVTVTDIDVYITGLWGLCSALAFQQ